ncbi:hypothetical protein NQ317_006436 [Molorchus minor]|uniref:C2H2-type domain-containing protein n=1 Tax=Molorchus minor TaxID=1323400 RepID=A0ABQ9IR55_9CUCU|nr:hypothetical protein NQ317_006436 [Molorchus minor]
MSELDYNIVELLVCRPCVGSLVSFLKFATVCATTEETITKNYRRIHSNSQDLVELNRMFCKENKNECGILRKRTLNIGSNDRPIKNNKVFVKTDKGKVKNVTFVAQQQQAVVHRENLKWRCMNVKCVILRQNKILKWRCMNVKCVIIRQNIKGSLKTHLLVHEENSEVEMYECRTCNFKTKLQGSLKTHLLVHVENSEMGMYECEMCNFKTKRKGSLKTHLLVHVENSEVEMYECETCNFKTKRKWSLKNHLLVHEENSEVEMYECETCNFKTKRKWSLKKHLLVHVENSEVEMYECETCNFKTKLKGI